ncbi:hypothetical protein CQW31_09410 [Pseudomonas sp. 382]|nr:hypothetical protein DZC31_02995 [Stenotrophomonas rhizophila]PIK78844.1 hypothetical protein CQW31_09410 [Pseudomonas sp. 382]
MALQLLSPVLRARAVPSVLSSGKTHCNGRPLATDGLFFIERATVCHAAGATTRTDKEQPSSAIIATLAGVYVQPPCNSGRHRSAHRWCATATDSTVSRLAGARKKPLVLALKPLSRARPLPQRPAQTQPHRKDWHNVHHSPFPEPL